MKFFTKVHNPKADPRTKKMVDATAVMFKESGMEGSANILKCTLAFFQATIRHAREIQSSETKGTNTDKLLEKQAGELKEILGKHGITDNEKQEMIILNYLNVVGNI
jgi:hypothetical protein